MKITAAGFVVAMMLAGCATPPASYSVTSSRGYNKPYDQAWEQLVGWFASKNIPIKNIAKDSGVIYAESVRFDDAVADCGNPGLFRSVSRSATFNVFLTRSGQPKISVNAQFSEVRRFESNIVTVQCNSRGTLEAMILDAVS